jgi:hypothetical protein
MNPVLPRPAARALALGLLVASVSLPPRRAGAEEAQTFVPWRYVDPMTGLEAFRALVPKGWRVEGSITWSANPALPATSRFRFFDPASGAELNLFPTQAFFWTSNALFLRTNPPGTLRFNTLVARPVDLDGAMAQMVLGRFRKGVSGLTVVDYRKVPELAQLARGQPVKGMRVTSDAGKARVTYVEGGKDLEEEVYAAVAQFAFDLPGGGGGPGYWIEYWYVDYVFSFRAPRGGLAARSKIFQTMIYSMKANPKWFAKVVNTKEALFAQMMQGVRNVGKIGSTVAAASSSLREDQMKDWERRQQVQDRVAQSQSDNIRGVERFHDPHADKEVELPSGYGHAWANNLGEYIVTDSPSYNPNVGSNLHWESMPASR